MTKLVHEIGGLVVVDHSAAAPYRLIDIDEIDADVVAVNAMAWGGPPIGALVFRDPAVIDSFSSVSLNPYATGAGAPGDGCAPVRLARAAWWPASNIWPNLDESAHGTRRERLAVSMQSAAAYMSRLFDYLLASLRSLPPVMVIGQPEVRIPVLSFAVQRRARRAGGAAAGRQRHPGDRRMRVRACWTSSASTTSAAR